MHSSQARPQLRARRRPLRRRRRWPLRRPARRVYRLAAVPGVAAVATLSSGSWWNPLDWQDFVDGIVEGMGEALVWLLDLAFNNPLTVVSAAEWQAALGQAARWGAVFAVVAVAICGVEIFAGIIASDHGRILRGWVWAILAWPLTAASLLVFSRLVNASDWLTTAILDSIQAPEAVTGAVAVTGATSAATTALVGMLLGVSVLSTWWLALVFVGLALLPVIGLVMVLGAVTFGQIALAGFAPIALMLIGFRGTRAMSTKWLQMAVALLLTKPIAAGIIALGCAVGAQGGADGLILGIIAVTVAMGSPALAFSFVGFAGAQLGGALTAHADKVKGVAGSVAYAGANQGVAALRDRLGGAAKSAATTAGAGTARAASGGAGVGGFGSTTTVARAGSSRPTAGGPGSMTYTAGGGKGVGRSAGQGGLNGSGKDSGKTRVTPGGPAGSSSMTASGAASAAHGAADRLGGGRSTAESASANPLDTAGPGSDGVAGHDEPRFDAADASPQGHGWPDDGVPSPPVADASSLGDASRLAGPVGGLTEPLAGQAEGGGGATGSPAGPSGAVGTATSGASDADQTAGGTASPFARAINSPSAGRDETPTGPGRPDVGAGSAARQSPAPSSGAAPAAKPSAPAEVRTTVTSGTPNRPNPAPPADREAESGPNPFGGAR